MRGPAPMPYIMVKNDDYRRLQELAGIFEVQDVVTKVLDEYLDNYTKPDYISKDEQAKIYTFDGVPSLSHAKFISGSFANVAASQSSWKGMMIVALETSFKRIGDVKKLQRISQANITQGEKNDDGYHFLENTGFSFQGLSAVYAAKCIHALAKELNESVEIEFRWRQKDEAALPGQAGKLVYEPR